MKVPEVAPTVTTCAAVLSLSFSLLRTLPTTVPFPLARALRSCGFRSQSVVFGMPRAVVVCDPPRNEKYCDMLSGHVDEKGKTRGRDFPRVSADIAPGGNEYLPPAGRTRFMYWVSRVRATYVHVDIR